MYHMIRIPADLTKAVSIITLKPQNLSRCLRRNVGETIVAEKLSGNLFGEEWTDAIILYNPESGLNGDIINARATFIADLPAGYISGDALITCAADKQDGSYTCSGFESDRDARDLIGELIGIYSALELCNT